MSDTAIRAITVTARHGGGAPMPMAEYKRIVAMHLTSHADLPLHVEYFGGANQITGYRLYYMLQFAKSAGVRHLSLLTDGGFWIDEATDWLLDSGVDEIVLTVSGGEIGAELAKRVTALTSRNGSRPTVRVRQVPPRSANDGLE